MIERAQAPWRRPWVAALTAVLVTVLAVAGVERLVAFSLANAERAAVIDRAGALRARLEQGVNRNVLLLRGLAAHLAAYPDMTEEDFTRIARQLARDAPHVRNLAITHGTVITYVYPRAPNREAVGVDLAAVPGQRQAVQRTIETRQTLVAGPTEVVQGGQGLIARLPVYGDSETDGSPGEGAFIGLVLMMLDPAGLWQEVGLFDPRHGLEVALRGRDATGGAGDVFLGEPALFERQPVLLEVSLAGAGSWRMAVLPQGGWGGGGAALWSVRVLALALAAAAGALAWTMAVRAADRRAVEEDLRRTATVDLATGADNHRRFLAAGAAEIARARRFGHDLSVMAIRLENAPGLDARHGAGAEAAALRGVVRRARRSLRVIDTVARVEPDLFAVLLPETPPAAAASAARRLVNRLELTGVTWRDGILLPHLTVAVTRLRREDANISATLARAVARLDDEERITAGTRAAEAAAAAAATDGAGGVAAADSAAADAGRSAESGKSGTSGKSGEEAA